MNGVPLGDVVDDLVDRVAVGDLDVVLGLPQLVQLLVREAAKLGQEFEDVLGSLEDLHVEVLPQKDIEDPVVDEEVSELLGGQVPHFLLVH